MPVLNMPLVDTTKLVLGPVVKGIIHDLHRLSGFLNPKSIIFLGDQGAAVPYANTMGADDERSLLNNDNPVYVEIDHDYLPESVLGTDVEGEESPKLLYDPTIGFKLVPVYTQTSLKMTVRAEYKSRTEALQWIKTMRLQTAKGRGLNPHQLEYSYLVPEELVGLLYTIHDLTEGLAPAGRSLADYLNEYRLTRWVSLTDQAGKNKAVGIAERQTGIVGFFDFDSEPSTPTMDEATRAWSVSFDYTVNFNMPIAINATFPLMVHNSPIPSEYIDTMELKSPDATLNHYQRYMAALTDYGNDHVPTGKVPGISIPHFDDWVPSAPPMTTVPLIRYLAKVSPTDPTALFLANGSKHWSYHPLLESYVTEDPSRLTHSYGGLVSLSVYANDHRMHHTGFYVDDDMVLRSKRPLDLSKTYHVLLSFNYHIAAMAPDVKEAIRKRGDLTQYMLSALYPDMPQVDLLPDGSFPTREFEKYTVLAYRYIERCQTSIVWNLKTVSLNFVEA